MASSSSWQRQLRGPCKFISRPFKHLPSSRQCKPCRWPPCAVLNRWPVRRYITGAVEILLNYISPAMGLFGDFRTDQDILYHNIRSVDSHGRKRATYRSLSLSLSFSLSKYLPFFIHVLYLNSFALSQPVRYRVAHNLFADRLGRSKVRQ